jgi:hypothetical protein
MMNKRDFLKGGATAVVAGTSATTALAAVRPSLDAQSGVASWRAHLGQPFQLDGHAVTLTAVTTHRSRQPGEQFSLSFTGALPSGMGNRIHELTTDRGEPVGVYLHRTQTGARADFCRLQG